jgi:hypothetical protein
VKFTNLTSSVALAALVLAGAGRAYAQTVPLLPDGIVVTVYGDSNTPETTTSGSATNYVDGVPTPISLQEFSATISSGVDNTTPLVDESLPDTGTNGNVGIVGEYGSSSEGTIQVSGNGQYLTIGGYDGNVDETGAPAGGYSNANGTAEAQSTDSNVPRVAAVIDIATGAVDTSTVLDDVYNTNNPRSIYSPDGTALYTSGQGAGTGDQGGLYLTSKGTNTTSGGTAPTSIFNGESTRTVTEFNVNPNGTSSSTPNLYYSADQNSKKGTLTGIFEYSGTPTTNQGLTNPGTRITPASVTIGSTSYNLSPDGFFFANPTTLYVADTGSPKAGGNADGGIQKWSFNSVTASWSLDYTLTFNFAANGTVANPDTETGFASLAAQVVGGVVDLYTTSYTSADDAPDGLYAVTDTLADTTAAQAAGESVVELAASGPDSDFKGVAFIDAPEPGTWALFTFGCIGLLAGGRRLRRHFAV